MDHPRGAFMLPGLANLEFAGPKAFKMDGIHLSSLAPAKPFTDNTVSQNSAKQQ